MHYDIIVFHTHMHIYIYIHIQMDTCVCTCVCIRTSIYICMFADPRVGRSWNDSSVVCSYSQCC